MTKPTGPEYGDQQSDALEIVPGSPVRIKAKELRLGRKLEILNNEGQFIVALHKNLPGNTPEEKSYTLELIGNDRALLPVPYFCNMPGFCIQTHDNEDVELMVPASATSKFQYRIAETTPPDISAIRPKETEMKELSKEWSEFALENDQCLVFYNHQKEPLARVHKAANTVEYILRDPQGNARAHLFEGDEAESGKEGNKLYFDVKDGKFRIKGDPSITLDVQRITPYLKIDAGGQNSFEEDQPHILHGLINGGRPVAIASYREVGKVKDDLLMRNEDNAGSNVDTAVVADGLGGHFHGYLASSEAVDYLLQAKGDFKKAVNRTHEHLVTFTGYFSQMVQEKRNFDEDEDMSGFIPPAKPVKDSDGRKSKALSVPDTVMVAVRFEGDKMETAVLGDSCIYVVRGDEIVYRSKEHSLVAQMVARGEMTKREAMVSLLRSTVVTTMVGSFLPDFDKFELQKGDRIILCSDGGVMRDQQMIECVQDQTAEEGVKRLLIEKRNENINGGDYYQDGEGGVVKMVSYDNVSYVLIVHD